MDILIAIFFLGFTFWSFWIVWSINTMRQSLSQIAASSQQQVSLLRKSVEGETIRSPGEMLKSYKSKTGAPKDELPEQAIPASGLQPSAYKHATAKDLLDERAKLLGSREEQN